MIRLVISALFVASCASPGVSPALNEATRRAAMDAPADSPIGRAPPSSASVAHEAAGPADLSTRFGRAAPEEEGLSSAALLKLTEWIRDHPMPIFSVLISRNGRLVYELYTSSIDPEQAHYLMSVTKSVVSALIGIAIDRRLLPGPDSSIAELLPRELFRSDEDLARFRPVTIARVLGMAALDAPDPPRRTDAQAIEHQRQFLSAPNRARFALTEPVLAESFQYNDETPVLASAILQYAAGKSALELAEEALFGPLDFRNYEWMHQDPSGLDNGGYGLRLRPIDMQKFGILFLNRGLWHGNQIISEAWIERTFTPWNKSRPDLQRPNYGWFWWTYYFGPGWTAHVANGWKGQRIAVIPDQRIVLTMTACIEDGSEEGFFQAIVQKILQPAVDQGGANRSDSLSTKLAAALQAVHDGPSRFRSGIEPRMVPSVAPKGSHVRFRR